MSSSGDTHDFEYVAVTESGSENSESVWNLSVGHQLSWITWRWFYFSKSLVQTGKLTTIGLNPHHQDFLVWGIQAPHSQWQITPYILEYFQLTFDGSLLNMTVTETNWYGKKETCNWHRIFGNWFLWMISGYFCQSAYDRK